MGVRLPPFAPASLANARLRLGEPEHRRRRASGASRRLHREPVVHPLHPTSNQRPTAHMKTELVDVSETRKNLVVEIPADKVDAELTRVTTRYGKPPACRLPARQGARQGHPPALQGTDPAGCRRAPGRPRRPGRAERARHAADRQPRHPEPRRQGGRAPHIHSHVRRCPPFDPGDFSTIELRRKPAPVEGEAVNQALERLRERAARSSRSKAAWSRRAIPPWWIWSAREPTRSEQRAKRTATRACRSKWARQATHPGSTIG